MWQALHIRDEPLSRNSWLTQNCVILEWLPKNHNEKLLKVSKQLQPEGVIRDFLVIKPGCMFVSVTFQNQVDDVEIDESDDSFQELLASFSCSSTFF